MKFCSHEELYIALTPTLEFLAENFPLVSPDETINRSIPRCRLCDLNAVNARELEAACPPPTFTNAIPGIRRHIELARQLISEDVRKEELEALLPLMKQTLEDEIRVANKRILDAWIGHWVVWRPGEGPERESDVEAEEESKLETEYAARVQQDHISAS